jgi:hypothetical protein
MGDVPRRKLSQAEIDAQRAGSSRLAPGAWVDKDGGLHYSVPELLELFGWPDTPENRRAVEEAILETVRKAAPDCKITFQD